MNIKQFLNFEFVIGMKNMQHRDKTKLFVQKLEKLDLVSINKNQPLCTPCTKLNLPALT